MIQIVMTKQRPLLDRLLNDYLNGNLLDYADPKVIDRADQTTGADASLLRRGLMHYRSKEK